MIHIRFYSLVLSAPIILCLSGMAVFVFEPAWSVVGLPIGWLTVLFGSLLQLIFLVVIACPKCRKSPYMYGRFGSLAGFAGKPLPDVICSSCGFNLRSGHDGERSVAAPNHEPDIQSPDPD